MRKIIVRSLLCFIVMFLSVGFAPIWTNAQNSKPSQHIFKTAPPTKYEPSPAFPYGRLNPKAPPETVQFSFMIGEFDCVDEILNRQTGKWARFPAIWNAKYFLNGHGIQDQYWSPNFSTSNIRIFDAKNKKWKVTFFQMPNYNASTPWEGIQEGLNLVMRKGNDEQGSRLTFHKISKDGFKWIGESMKKGRATPFWKSSCKRRR